LGNLQKLSALRADSRLNRRKIKEHRLKRDKITAEIQELEKGIDKLDDELIQFREKHLREKRQHLTQVEQIRQLAEARVHLYESERLRALKFVQSSRNRNGNYANY
jgi:chromosome segregation ATPase